MILQKIGPVVGITLVNWSRMTDRPTDHLTLDEAAAVLGISREAVRLRVRRGTLAGQRVKGVWYVASVGWSPTDHATNQPTDRPGRGRGRGPAARNELLDHLEAENAWLRARVEFYERQVEHQAGEIAELRRQLPPPAPPQGVGERSAPATPPTMPPTATEKSLTRRKRKSWLGRLLGR
jgi:hypothetical protein